MGMIFGKDEFYYLRLGFFFGVWGTEFLNSKLHASLLLWYILLKLNPIHKTIYNPTEHRRLFLRLPLLWTTLLWQLYRETQRAFCPSHQWPITHCTYHTALSSLQTYLRAVAQSLYYKYFKGIILHIRCIKDTSIRDIFLKKHSCYHWDRGTAVNN